MYAERRTAGDVLTLQPLHYVSGLWGPTLWVVWGAAFGRGNLPPSCTVLQLGFVSVVIWAQQ